jgi:hypothetical protein
VPGSPDEAWQAWNRRGVAQFRQPHYLHAAGRQILDAALPEVTQTLLGAGAMFRQAFGVAMLYDPDVFRDMMEFISMMALPEQVFTRPGFGDRVAAAADGHEAFAPPGPSRSDLLRALA